MKPLQIKIIADNKRLEANQEITFQCIVYGARPQPTISWSLIDDQTNELNNVNNFIENELSSSSAYFDSNWFTDAYQFDKSIKNSTNLKSKTTERFKLMNKTSYFNNNKLNDDTTVGLSFQAAKKAAITQVLNESENIHSSQIRFRLNEK